jgi:transposase
MRAYSLDLRRKVVETVIRGMPKAAAARNFGIGRALSAVTARDVWGFFEHCGYHPSDRPLFDVLVLPT